MSRPINCFLSIFLVLMVMTLLLPLNIFAKDSFDEYSETVISFKENVNLAEIADFVDSYELKMSEIRATLPNDNNVILGFVISNQTSFRALWEDFSNQHKALSEEGIKAYEENSEIIEQMIKNHEAISAGKFILKQIIFKGVLPDSVIKEMSEYIIDCQIYAVETLTNNNITGNPEIIEYNSTSNFWLPTSGSASACPSTVYNDATLLTLTYKWNNSTALSYFGEKSTLEAEIVLRNYYNEAIATAWKSNYAYETNQPQAYRDTQFTDSDDEINFSIGCAKAENFVANYNYYWLAYGNRTTSSSCQAKLMFQKGHRLFADVYSTWTIFADETVKVIPFYMWTTGNTVTFGTV